MILRQAAEGCQEPANSAYRPASPAAGINSNQIQQLCQWKLLIVITKFFKILSGFLFESALNGISTRLKTFPWGWKKFPYHGKTTDIRVGRQIKPTEIW
jgi:hypothetical protein